MQNIGDEGESHKMLINTKEIERNLPGLATYKPPKSKILQQY